MSIHAISAVFLHSESRHDCRLTMLALAEFAGDDGVSWPGQETIAERAACATRTVRSCLRALEKLGEVETRTIQSGRRRFNAYRLLLPGLKAPDMERLERQGFTLSEPWTTGRIFRPSDDDRKSATTTTGNLHPVSPYIDENRQINHDVVGDRSEEFEAIIAGVGSATAGQRGEWRAGFEDDREGFARVVEEALNGDRPAALLTNLVRRNAHLEAPPIRKRSRSLTPEEIRNIDLEALGEVVGEEWT